MKKYAVISVAVAPIYKKPSFSSEMVSQGLLWEKVEVIKKNENWYYIVMEDGYTGWINSFYLMFSFPSFSNSYIVTQRFLPIYKNIKKSNSVFAFLSFGTNIPLIKTYDNFLKVMMPDKSFAYVPYKNDEIIKNRQSIIRFADLLIGVPYLWGGKSTYGYDCSGFVQMIMKVVGISMDRDSNDQIKTHNLEKIYFGKEKPGDLIFFSNEKIIKHVGILMGDGNIIHSSGQVKIESIIKDEPGFSIELSEYKMHLRSISKLLNI